MASNAGWNKNVPSGTSSIAQGDDDMRSSKSILQAAWEEEHYFTDGSANSAGEHKLGSARAYQGTASQLSNPRAGALFHDQTNNLLFVGSASSYSNVGGAGVNSVNTWTARQAFSVIDLGSDLYSLTEEKLALTQTALGPSAGTVVDFQTGNIKRPMAISALQLARDEQILQSISYNSTDNQLMLTLFNPSASTITISAQSVHVSVMSFI